MDDTQMQYWQPSGHQKLWEKLSKNSENYDVIVIGGGITGAGVALEASKHGQKVLLVERQDFAWGTSSRSSKMVHGGLRYMAQGDLKTTRESVQERETLLREAPGLVSLMNYAMPHYKRQFPPFWLFYMLLWLYDLFARKRYRTFVKAQKFSEQNPELKKEGLVGASQFSDAVTDDSRLVMRVLHEAQYLGAECINYVAVTQLIKKNEQVKGVRLVNQLTQQSCEVFAKIIINATGAWVDELRGQLGQSAKIRPARGSHLVLSAERLKVTQSLTLLHPKDQRPVFIYPWEGRTVVGTTDIDHGALGNQEATVSLGEMNYLFDLLQHYFPQAELAENDIIATFSGVRPLIAGGALNPSKEKRSHSVWVEQGLVSVSGGKLTTFRVIALDALAHAKKALPNWRNAASNKMFQPAQCQEAPFLALPVQVQRRLLGYYGMQTDSLMNMAQENELLAIADTPLLWAELRFSARYESAQHLDDLLLRRTRLGLLLHQGGAEFKDKIKVICQQELVWDEQKWQQEWQRYQNIWQAHYSLPQSV